MSYTYEGLQSWKENFGLEETFFIDIRGAIGWIRQNYIELYRLKYQPNIILYEIYKKHNNLKY